MSHKFFGSIGFKAGRTQTVDVDCVSDPDESVQQKKFSMYFLITCTECHWLVENTRSVKKHNTDGRDDARMAVAIRTAPRCRH